MIQLCITDGIEIHNEMTFNFLHMAVTQGKIVRWFSVQVMCLSGSWFQERKLSLQQLHSMSDEEWRSLKLPVVGVDPYTYVPTIHNVLVVIIPHTIYTTKLNNLFVHLAAYQCQPKTESPKQ